MSSALLLIDLQNDFCPGGALAVPRGDEAVAVANAVRRGELGLTFDLTVATQDWHPRGHGSFASAHPGRKPFELGELAGRPQMLWPDHCVQHTPGADFHPDLDLNLALVVRKGTDPRVDSYSALYDNHRAHSTGLSELLRRFSVRDAYVLGLATDYCVKATVLDLLQDGFAATLVTAGCRGITPETTEAAIAEMRAAGAQIR